jgi:hypothetical protein
MKPCCCLFSLNAKIPCAFALEDLQQQIAAGFPAAYARQRPVSTRDPILVVG